MFVRFALSRMSGADIQGRLLQHILQRNKYFKCFLQTSNLRGKNSFSASRSAQPSGNMDSRRQISSFKDLNVRGLRHRGETSHRTKKQLLPISRFHDSILGSSSRQLPFSLHDSSRPVWVSITTLTCISAFRYEAGWKYVSLRGRCIHPFPEIPTFRAPLQPGMSDDVFKHPRDAHPSWD